MITQRGDVKKTKATWTLIGLGLLSGGCGESLLGICDEPSTAALEAVSGIYQATSYTQNESSCDMEGPSLLADLRDPFFVVTTRSELGREVGLLVTCADAAECRSKSAMVESGVSGQLLQSLSCAGSDSSITGETETAGQSGIGEACGAKITSSTLLRNGNSIRLENRIQHGESYEPDGEGFCDLRTGINSAKDAPCTELVVLTGDFVEAL